MLSVRELASADKVSVTMNFEALQACAMALCEMVESSSRRSPFEASSCRQRQLTLLIPEKHVASFHLG